MLQDIKKASSQFKIELYYTIICHLSCKLNKRYLKNTWLPILKLWNNLAEDENHWFATYWDHHKEKLRIEILFYNGCLLITMVRDENFGKARLQIDNILNVWTKPFIKNEEKEIIAAKFKAKNRTILEIIIFGDFNNCCITIEVELIIVVEKNEVEKFHEKK